MAGLDKIIDLIVQFLEFFRFCTIVFDYEGGVVLRWGRFNRMLEPGFHWLWPFYVEHHHTCWVVPNTARLEPQSLTTKDKQSAIVGAVITFVVSDPRKYLLEVEGEEAAMRDILYGAVSDVVLSKTWDELIEADVLVEIKRGAHERAKKYGIKVIEVKWGDMSANFSLRILGGQPHPTAPHQS